MMPTIAIFNRLFCDATAVVQKIVDLTGYRLVTDQEIIADAARISGISEAELAAVFQSNGSTSSTLSHGDERLVGWLRLALANKLCESDELIVSGFVSLLPSPVIGHILKVCLISETDDRVKIAVRDVQRSVQDALDLIHADDDKRAAWVKCTRGVTAPWAEGLYDLVIPTASIGAEQSARLVAERLADPALQVTKASRGCLDDFLLTAKVQAALLEEGHSLSVSAKEGTLKLIITNHETFLQNMARCLCNFVSKIDGVKSVEAGVGRGYHQGDVYPRLKLRHPLRDAVR